VEFLEARISARSQKQAMDWSLVLLSQGIESTLSAEEGRWALLVPSAQYEVAVRILRQYRLENRGWPWQQELFRPGVLFDWGSMPLVILLGVFYWLDLQSGLRVRGVMDSGLVVQGEWWRLFTAIWLHGDLAHLASNASIGLLLLGLAMGAYGTGMGVLVAILSGAIGNLAALALDPISHRSLGASGMIMGALGMLAAQSLQTWTRSAPGIRKILMGIAAGFMLFVLLGLSPGTDIIAHTGGFVGGMLLGGSLLLVRLVNHRTGLNLACGFCSAILILYPWYLALRGGQ
jgi:rhomboid protease GluP